MRWAPAALLLAVVAGVVGVVGCSDLRDFHGTWSGPRVGDSRVLAAHVPDGNAQLTIDSIDEHGLSGQLAIDGLIAATPVQSVTQAEADVLSGITFSGAPLRVYLAFAPVSDPNGDALVIIALYDDHRVELRVLRGRTPETSLYGIYTLREAAAVAGSAASLR